MTFSSFERLEVVTGLGDDTVLGGALDDWLSVGSGANSVNAKAGNDTVTYVARDANTLRGGEGDDTLVVSSGTSNLYFILDPFDGSVDDGSLSDILGFEHFVAIGSEFDDVTSFGAGRDVFNGAAGRDSSVGRDGADMLSGESGADSLEGGSGRDTLLGGSGCVCGSGGVRRAQDRQHGLGAKAKNFIHTQNNSFRQKSWKIQRWRCNCHLLYI